MCASIVQNSESLTLGAEYKINSETVDCATISDNRPAYQRVGKRIFDLALTVAAVPILLPILLAIAVAIKLESRGPVFYAQRRTGHLGVPFFMYKFRSMQVNAEALRGSLLHLNEATWPEFKLTKDPRITRVGQFLRATSLDELPQLFNVLKGEMSLVGPRACSARPEEYEPWQLSRLSVTPGIAGPAQLFCRHASFDEKCRRELEYVAHQSFARDVELLFKILAKLLTAPDGK